MQLPSILFSTARAVLLSALVAAAAAGETLQLEPVKDNTLYENPTGARSNGAGPGLFTGKSFAGIRRTVLAFDLSSLPSESIVSSVTLTLSCDQSVSPVADFELHRLLADWGEGASVAGSGPGAGDGGGAGTESMPGDATWIHRFYPGTLWTTPGGDFSPVGSATQAVGILGYDYVWGSTPQLVADVQGWLSAPGSNFGWILLGGESTTFGSAKRFSSREVDPSFIRPRLTVDYTVPVALERKTWTAVQALYR